MKLTNKILLYIGIATLPLHIFAQSETYDYGSGEDSIRCLQNLSVYQNRYRNEEKTSDFAPETMKAWRNAFFQCPKGSQNMYSPHGVKMFETLFKNTQDETLKAAYIDTIKLIYDRRIEYFGEKERYLGYKGADIFMLNSNLFEEAYSLCKESVDGLGNNSDVKTIIILMQTAVIKVANNTMKKPEAIALYQQLDGILEYNSKKGSNTHESWRKNLEAIFLRLNPDCSDLIATFEPQFKANPEDTELLKKITSYLAKNCTESDLYLQAAINLDKIEPSALSKRNIAEMYVSKKETSLALQYFQQSIDIEESSEQKAATYYTMANVVSSNPSLSVSYAQKALALNPNMGIAYILIARQYVAGSSECGKGTDEYEVEKWKAFWVAEDLCIKAKNIDASVTAQANTDISKYRKYFPDIETMFGYDITEGSTQTINCWFSATTTAKAK
ncbi:MAG: hypothetical protein M0R02_02010 [Bacteroidales bacterium]|nr:hypothetical protein [Bacteroidales bacterium]NLK80955.1 hypothetical protein [Bacteroidales bacterium]